MTSIERFRHTSCIPSCTPFCRRLQVRAESVLNTLHTFLTILHEVRARMCMRVRMCAYVKLLVKCAGYAGCFKYGYLGVQRVFSLQFKVWVGNLTTSGGAGGNSDRFLMAWEIFSSRNEAVRRRCMTGHCNRQIVESGWDFWNFFTGRVLSPQSKLAETHNSDMRRFGRVGRTHVWFAILSESTRAALVVVDCLPLDGSERYQGVPCWLRMRMKSSTLQPTTLKSIKAETKVRGSLSAFNSANKACPNHCWCTLRRSHCCVNFIDGNLIPGWTDRVICVTALSREINDSNIGLFGLRNDRFFSEIFSSSLNSFRLPHSLIVAGLSILFWGTSYLLFKCMRVVHDYVADSYLLLRCFLCKSDNLQVAQDPPALPNCFTKAARSSTQ